MSETTRAAAVKAVSNRAPRKWPIAKGIVLVFLSILFVTQIYPLVWLFIYSLKSNEEILSGSFFALPAVPQWNNFHDAVQSGNYFKYLYNSIFVTLVTMVGVLLLSALASFAIRDRKSVV